MRTYRVLRVLRIINLLGGLVNLTLGLYHLNWLSIINFLGAIYCLRLAFRIHKMIGTEMEEGTVSV